MRPPMHQAQPPVATILPILHSAIRLRPAPIPPGRRWTAVRGQALKACPAQGPWPCASLALMQQRHRMRRVLDWSEASSAMLRDRPSLFGGWCSQRFLECPNNVVVLVRQESDERCELRLLWK